MNDVIKIHWYHKNLKAMGFTICGRYFDFTFPFREGFGWKFWRHWKNAVRLYWKDRNGNRHYLYLPSFTHTVVKG